MAMAKEKLTLWAAGFGMNDEFQVGEFTGEASGKTLWLLEVPQELKWVVGLGRRIRKNKSGYWEPNGLNGAALGVVRETKQAALEALHLHMQHALETNNERMITELAKWRSRRNRARDKASEERHMYHVKPTEETNADQNETHQEPAQPG